MPRAKREPSTPKGRPQKEIDWTVVDDLLEAGCLGTEIASYFDVHPVTFYDRVVLEKGTTFTEYSSGKKPKGEALIRQKQYKKAIEGDNVMLVWLGKNRLLQRETTEVSFPEDAIKAFVGVMGQLDSIQKLRAAPKQDSEKPPEDHKPSFKSNFH